MPAIQLISYHPALQPEIDRMMENIQSEFAQAITSRHSTIIEQVYRLPNHRYWVARCGAEVAGTIGAVLPTRGFTVVKRMMVDRKFRGDAFGTARALMDAARDWSLQNGAGEIFLGTMAQFVAAQKFYLKYGFEEIGEKDLPAGYPHNPMDTVFFRLMPDESR